MKQPAFPLSMLQPWESLCRYVLVSFTFLLQYFGMNTVCCQMLTRTRYLEASSVRRNYQTGSLFF